MKILVHICAMALLLALPSITQAQQVDRSEMDQWLAASAKQGDIPVGTKITMSNWQQYQQFMPFGMVQLFEGKSMENA